MAVSLILHYVNIHGRLIRGDKRCDRPGFMFVSSRIIINKNEKDPKLFDMYIVLFLLQNI